MSATTGYFVAGSSWLHRRNPLTKLLALAFILLAAFLLPPIGAARARRWSSWPRSGRPACCGRWRERCASRRCCCSRSSSSTASSTPARRTCSPALGPAVDQPGGPDLRARSRPAGSWSSSSPSVAFLFTTLADDLLESLIARGASHRISFVVLSAVQMVPRMQERAGAILEAQQARGLSLEGSFGRRIRALVPLIGPVVLGSLVDVRERTFALEARGFGARPARTAYRVVADPPVDRWLRLGLRARLRRGRRRGRDRRRPVSEDGAAAPIAAGDRRARRPLPGHEGAEPRRRRRSRSRAGERVGRRRPDRRRQVDARAGGGRVHPAGRPGQGGWPGRDRRHRPSAPRADALARAGRDRLRDAGQPAVGLEADRARGARLRAREPRRPAGRDGPADRRHARAPGDRAPRRPRAVRAVGRRAAARGDRQHRGDGHARARPRRADRPARPCRHGAGRRPARGAGPRRERRSSAPSTTRRVLGRAGPLPRARRRPAGRARRPGRGACGGGARRGPPAADARPAGHGRRARPGAGL